jgi:D-lyxose ketol-isomerase
MVAGLVGGTAVSLTALNACSMHGGKLVAPVNEDYYKPDGTFDEAKAKQAYYDMMAFYNYPIPDRLRGEEFWTLDFGLGKFSEVGMAGIFWINNQEHNYMGHEIYLLPGQMIPEHWHVKTADVGAKLEGWHVRHGSVTLFAEGEPSPGVDEVIPPIHRDIAMARKMQVVKPGEVGYLANPEERHFMLAGPDGAIVSEYATYHTMDALRFTHPDIKL